uniref:Uncharacterized protein n=1 Tax=Ananas comosus var. bracteatus TaxID=296719 RepID=A0A6V7Q917_ANACO|nr:unnamed protein product [Ananas comosus var. bracteatus]
MAEAAVFHVLSKIAASLSDELVKEVSALLEVKNSMKQIESEFAVMQAFISQVNAYDSRNETLAAWLEQVKKVAFEVEDIIDEYTYLVGEEKVGGFRNFLKKVFHNSKNITAWHGIAAQLKQVETRLERLTTMRDRYGILLRSFILFDKQLPSSSIENASSSFKLLRVLCFQHAKMEQIPDTVFDLFNLHYLDLQYTEVKSIPKSLGKLQNLQTLDLSMTRVEKLPREVATLTKLRHLAVSVPHDICRLKGLQTLLNIEADKFLMQNIGSLTSLRKLFVMKVRGAYCTELWASLKMMPGLAALAVVTSDKDELLRLDSMHPLPSLQKLYLKGRLDEDEAPTVFANFRMLQDLRLDWSGLQTDPLHSFSHMSSLVNLQLYRVYEGRRLSFRAGWFPRLKNLLLADMAQVSVIDIEDGAMKSLYRLHLIGLSSLTATPAGVVYLRSLQEMYLIDMPPEFIRRLRTSDRSKVQHIPSVC